MFNSRSTDNRLADTLDVRYNQFDIDEDHPTSTNGRHQFALNEHCDDYEDLFEGDYDKINFEAERSVTTSDEQSEQNDDLDTTYANEVYMSVIWHNNQMGMAYYDSDKEYIYFLADVQETSDYETLDLLLRDLRPCVILTNSNADDVLIEHMKTVCADNFDKRFQMVPSQYFSYEACMKRILELKLPNLASMTHNERVVYLKTLLNFDSVMMIRSLGALLKYLDRNRIHVELEAQAVSTPIKKIRPITVDNILHVDENSLNALQVFHSISHPSVYKIDANREGFSLFGMFANKLRTKYGIAKLRSWLLKPTRDLGTIKQRHGLIDFFLDMDNFEYKSRLEALLKTFNKNIKQIFKRMQCKQLTVNDWNYLSKTTVSLIKLLGLLSEVRATQNKHSKVFDEFFRFDDGDYSSILNSVVQSLMKIIDFKQTNETKRVCILDNIDFDLDRKRDIYRRLPEYLTKIAYEQLEKLNISECNIVYMPQIGFLLVIRLGENCTDKDQTSFEFKNNLKFVFKDEQKFYYTNGLMAHLDSKYGDILCDIRRIETRVLSNLQEILQKFSYVYNQLFDSCAEIDVCLAYAYASLEYNYVKPVISPDRAESFIYAQRSRHPLMELSNSTYVPNDIYSGTMMSKHLFPNMQRANNELQAFKLKVITGPNACGKTVYMKQVALLVYMCYIGSYVPADYACLGDIDRIHTRINSTTTSALHKSTFFVDLQQVCNALNAYTCKSLMIIDEFGKGTHSTDGPLLLAAFIRYLMRFDHKLPHAFISTHYQEILRDNILRANMHTTSVDVEYLSFEYMKQLSEANNATIVYLYNLKPNSVAYSSCAIDVAQSVGIKESIVFRARHILDIIKSNKKIQALHTIDTNRTLSECKELVKEFLETCDANSEDPANTGIHEFRRLLYKIKKKAYVANDSLCVTITADQTTHSNKQESMDIDVVTNRSDTIDNHLPKAQISSNQSVSNPSDLLMVVSRDEILIANHTDSNTSSHQK